MVIRKKQMDTFESDAGKKFTDFMQSHLAEHFPEHSKALRPEGVRRAIKAGIKRAGKYEINSERDVCKFIDLQFAFGESFDSDRKYPWAAAVLNDPEIHDPTRRIETLVERAQAYLNWLRAKGEPR